MDKLSYTEAAFLYMETHDTPMNMGSVSIFEAPADPATNVFQIFRDHTAARIHLLPSYQRRLQMTPLNLDHPVWAMEEHPDLDYHIRHLALPAPGSMQQLRELIADLHVVPLDRARPLWQYFVIEGLEGGRFAVFVKIHHATMDGMSGMSTMPIVYDFSPVPVPPPPPKTVVAEVSSLPQWVGGAIDRFFDRQQQLIVAGPKIATALAKVTRRLATTMRLLPEGLHLAPKTPLNVSVSHDRSFGTASISLSQVKAVAKTRNVTVNDIILALCAGSLSRYLTARQALPKEALIAAVPVSLREPGDNDLKVQAGLMLSTLATDVADPLERLAAISAAAGDAKARLSDIRQTISGEMGDLLLGSPLLAPALGWLVGYTRISDLLRPVMNVLISNVPGPRKPYYCAGCRAVSFFPVSIPYHGAALNITNQSYMDNIDFGLVGCRATIPDVQEIADGLVAAFEELKQASEAASDPSAIEFIEIPRPTEPATAAPRLIAIDLPEPVLVPPTIPTPKPPVAAQQPVDSISKERQSVLAVEKPPSAAPRPTRATPAPSVAVQHSALAELEAAIPAQQPAIATSSSPVAAQQSALAALKAFPQSQPTVVAPPVSSRPSRRTVKKPSAPVVATASPKTRGTSSTRTPPKPAVAAPSTRTPATKKPKATLRPAAVKPQKSKRR